MSSEMVKDPAIAVAEYVLKMRASIVQLRCDKCDLVFNKQSSLSRHEKIHWAEFRCGKDGCEKAFSSHKHLSKHLKRHSDTKLVVRIVPFNIRTKIEFVEELADDDAGSSLLVQDFKKEVEDEQDQTGDLDRNNGQAVQQEDNATFCDCVDCIKEAEAEALEKRKLLRNDTTKDDLQMDHSGIFISQASTSYTLSSNSLSHQPQVMSQLISAESEETKLWLRGEMERLADPTINSLFLRLIMAASVEPQRSLTVSELRQLIEREMEKTNRLIREEMDQLVNSLFLRLTNKVLMNMDWTESKDDRTQIGDASDQFESSEPQPSTSSTSSFNSDQTDVSKLMFRFIAAERVDSKLWLRGEMVQLADPMITSLFFRLITSTETQHSSTVSELCQMIEGQKEETNRLVRVDLDRVVNSLFLRLTNKFLVNMDWAESEDVRSQVEKGAFDHVELPNSQSHQQSSFILSSSNSVALINPKSHQPNSINDEFEPDVTSEIGEGYEIASQSVQDNTLNVNPQFGQLIEIDEFDEQDQSYQNDNIALSHQVSTNSLSTDDQYLIHYTTDDGLENQTIHDVQQSNGIVNNSINYDIQLDRDEIEEENDDEQMMELEEKEDEETEIESDSDGEVYKNDQDEKSPRHLANPPIDATLVTNQSQPAMGLLTRFAKRKKTEQEHPDKMAHQDNQEDTEDDKEYKVTSRSAKRTRLSRPNKQTQIITHSLQCPVCGQMVGKDKFHKHIEDHLIGPFRCVVKDCGQTFATSQLLGHHITQSHQSTIQWDCDKCAKHFTSYKNLCHHKSKLHQLGHFQCSFPACTFTGDYRSKVFHHYLYQHKSKLVCYHPGCNFKTPRLSILKTHERVHLGIKPYKCKWSHCGYASTERYKTIDHIRRMHFKGKTISSVRLGKYVEVNEMLLNNPEGHDDDDADGSDR